MDAKLCKEAKLKHNVICKDEPNVCWQLYNRDLAAILNFKHIVDDLHTNGKIPEWFRCSKKPVASSSDAVTFSAIAVSSCANGNGSTWHTCSRKCIASSSVAASSSSTDVKKKRCHIEMSPAKKI
ncbi:hypothetical protein LPJ64_001156 [Coemansia asiatica]|uniref:Uncharacterized protein n=1 Tax=Coemansia asiatica TaxID=1052880 RepID=A0A9W7XQM5_9FUNG|nr:hypothetical protein LPJ64_001156 [Coemansia asiatica]